MNSQVTLVAIAVVGLAALLAVSEASLTSEVKRCSDEWTRCVDAEELAQIPENERRYIPGIPSDKCSMRYSCLFGFVKTINMTVGGTAESSNKDVQSQRCMPASAIAVVTAVLIAFQIQVDLRLPRLRQRHLRGTQDQLPIRPPGHGRLLHLH